MILKVLMLMRNLKLARPVRWRNHKYRLLAIGVLLSIGGYFIVSSTATGPIVSSRVEAESNSLTGSASVAADILASGGDFLQLGTNESWPTTNDGLINLVTDPTAVYSVPGLPQPAYLATQTVAPFGTKLTRITGDHGTALTGISGTWSTDARHHYSKDQPWNADQTLIAEQNTTGGGGTPKELFLDGTTYQPKYSICPNYSLGEDRWSQVPGHPNERVNVNGTSLEWFDVTTCTQIRHWTLPFAVTYFGMGEGNTSFDGRYVILGTSSQMFVVDMDPQSPYSPYPSQRIGPTTPLAGCGVGSCAATWVSVSPSGKYGVVHYSGEAIQVWDINPVTLALTPRNITQSYAGCLGSGSLGFIYSLGHADMTQNPYDNNEDVIIGQEKCGNLSKTINGHLVGHVVMSRLKDGAMTSLTSPTNEASPHHISGRSFDRPGWVYVSYFGTQPSKKYNDEIVAVKLDGSGSVERLSHQHSLTSGCYRCETHAVPSLDGTKVIFASNWAQDCATLCGPAPVGSSYIVNDYVVDAHSAVSGGLGGAPCLTLPNNTASSTVILNVGATDTYNLWSRLKVPDTTRNSIWVQVDSGCPVRVADSASLAPGSWTWVDYQDGAPPVKTLLSLSSGTHTVKIVGAESGVQVDELLATNDPTCTPTGDGSNCSSSVTGGATPTPAPSTTPTPAPTPTPATPTPTPSPGGSSGTPIIGTGAGQEFVDNTDNEVVPPTNTGQSSAPSSNAATTATRTPYIVPPRHTYQTTVPVPRKTVSQTSNAVTRSLGLLGGILSIILAIGLAILGL